MKRTAAHYDFWPPAAPVDGAAGMADADTGGCLMIGNWLNGLLMIGNWLEIKFGHRPVGLSFTCVMAFRFIISVSHHRNVLNLCNRWNWKQLALTLSFTWHDMEPTAAGRAASTCSKRSQLQLCSTRSINNVTQHIMHNSWHTHPLIHWNDKLGQHDPEKRRPNPIPPHQRTNLALQHMMDPTECLYWTFQEIIIQWIQVKSSDSIWFYNWFILVPLVWMGPKNNWLLKSQLGMFKFSESVSAKRKC